MRIRRSLELSPRGLLEVRRRRPAAKIVPFRGARMRLIGDVYGGGHVDVGVRWPDSFFSSTQFIVQAGGSCEVTGDFNLITGSSVVVGPGARLKLTSGLISEGASIACFSSIVIGEDVGIAPGVIIRDSDSHSVSGPGSSTRPIVIGDHVWIGMRAIILKGVTIGDGAVIAAGAIVSKDVPPNTLVAGTAARPLRTVSWDHDPDVRESMPAPVGAAVSIEEEPAEATPAEATPAEHPARGWPPRVGARPGSAGVDRRTRRPR